MVALFQNRFLTSCEKPCMRNGFSSSGKLVTHFSSTTSSWHTAARHTKVIDGSSSRCPNPIFRKRARDRRFKTKGGQPRERTASHHLIGAEPFFATPQFERRLTAKAPRLIEQPCCGLCRSTGGECAARVPSEAAVFAYWAQVSCPLACGEYRLVLLRI